MIFSLKAFCDSDWGACPRCKKSISGFLVFLGHMPLSCKSKKQSTISLSSVEAEYRSTRRVTVELAWLSKLLHELTVKGILQIPVHCDNQASIYIAKTSVYHERTEHIELNCHFVSQKLLEGLISLFHTPTNQQLADILTKPLTGVQHSQILSKLGVFARPPTRGGC